MSVDALIEAGIRDVPCWFDEDGTVHFDERASAADRQRVLEAIAAYDPLPRIKRQRIEENRREAQRRIAQALGLTPDTPMEKLLVKEANMLMQAVALLDKQANGGALTQTEQDELAQMRAIKATVDAIRSAENAAAVEINRKLKKETVEAVQVQWPA